MENKNYLTLKWGTLKSWSFPNPKQNGGLNAGEKLLKEYDEIGSSFSAMQQRDTPRQKDIICELIDLCDGNTIYLEWDDQDVSKQKAKDYVMRYNLK